MSRSYKHTPYCGDEKNKFFKRYANRKLRRNKLKHNLQYKSYRKNFPSWDICDYYSIYFGFEDYYKIHLRMWYDFNRNPEDKPTREQCWKDFKKYYLNK